jgi:hypothetical protein
MYYNGIVNDAVRSIMDKEDVTLIQWDYLYRLDGRPHPFPHHAQLGQLHHAIYAFGKGTSEYMIFNDFDEYFDIPGTTLGSFVSDRRYDLIGFQNQFALTMDGSIPTEFPTKFQKSEVLKWANRSKNIHKLDRTTTIGIHQLGHTDAGVYRIDLIMYHFSNWSQPGRLLGGLVPQRTWSFFKNSYIITHKNPENAPMKGLEYECVKPVNGSNNIWLRQSYIDRKIIGEFPYDATILGQLASHRMIWERALYDCERGDPTWILIMEEDVCFHPLLTDELMTAYMSSVPSNAKMLKFGYIRNKGDDVKCIPENKYWISLKTVRTYSMVCYAIRSDLLPDLVKHCWMGPIDQLIIPNCYGMVNPEEVLDHKESTINRIHTKTIKDAEECIQGGALSKSDIESSCSIPLSLSVPMIPNIIHFIFGLREQKEDFLFSFYLSVLSAYVVNKPDTIYFYYHYEPKGVWWEKLKKIPSLVLQIVDLPTHFGAKPIFKTAHRADKLRMDILYNHGGIYMDIDTISVRSYKSFLQNEVVLGIEDTKKKAICNAFMMSIPKSQFFTIWLKNYEHNFDPQGWGEASILLPGIVAERYPSFLTLKEQRAFFYPSWNEIDKIFVIDHDIPSELVTLHLWESHSIKYLTNMSLSWILKNPTTLYSRIISYLLETTDIQQYLLLK